MMVAARWWQTGTGRLSSEQLGLIG